MFSQWREHQAEQMAKRDEESKAKRAETVAKAERDIDKFYEEYNAKKERTIRENKYVLRRPRPPGVIDLTTDMLSTGKMRLNIWLPSLTPCLRAPPGPASAI
jgi:hypothetical protein